MYKSFHIPLAAANFIVTAFLFCLLRWQMGVPIAYGHAFAGFLLLSSFGFLAVGFDVLTWVDSWLQNPALQKPRIFFAVYVAPLSLGCVSFFKTPYWWAFMFGPYFLGIFGMIFAQTVISFAENNIRNQQQGND